MRSLLLIITMLFSLALAALGYIAYNYQIDLYIIIFTIINPVLLYLCSDFIGRIKEMGTFLRFLVVLITTLGYVALIFLGHTASEHQIDFGLYIIVSTSISICLAFLCGHFIYLYHEHQSKRG